MFFSFYQGIEYATSILIKILLVKWNITGGEFNPDALNTITSL